MTIKFSSIPNETIGKYLKKIREQKNISLEEISRFTKIKIHFLNAIEDDRMQDITDLTYARLTILNYARYIGADTNEVLNFFDKHTKKKPEKKVIGSRVDKKKDYEKKVLIPKIVFQIVLLIFFVTILFGVGFYLNKKGELQRNIFEKPKDYSSEQIPEQKDVKKLDVDKTQETAVDTTSREEIKFKYKEGEFLQKYIFENKQSPWYVVPKYIKSEKSTTERNYKNWHKEHSATSRY